MKARRTQGLGSFVAPLGLFALIAGTVAFGWAASLSRQNDSQPNATPSPTETHASYWQQQLADAQVSLESNSTALHAAWLDGQDTARLSRQWCAAAKAHNTAARHLAGIDQISTKDCP